MQGLSKTILGNNKLRKDLQADIRARETLRKSIKDGLDKVLDENDELLKLCQELQVRILATKAEAKAIDQRCQELQPSVREIDFWKAEQENLSFQLLKMQEKEKELQKTSFEALIVSLKDVQIMRETGVLGHAKVYEGKIGNYQAVIYMFEKDHFAAMVRLQEELGLMRFLGKCSSLVRVLGVTVLPEPFSIIVEATPAGDLYSYLHDETRSSALSWRTRLRIATDIAEALHACHNMRPPHIYGHLTSERVFLVETAESGLPTVKLSVLDFVQMEQTAELFQRDRRPYAWLAPEVLRNEPLTFRSDTYSFGIILWELLTRRRPFDDVWLHSTSQMGAGMTVADRERAIMAGARPAIPDDCPGEYRELIEWCWHQDPNARPLFPLVLEKLSGIAQRIAPLPPNMIVGRFYQRSDPIESPINCLCLVDTQVWAGCEDGSLYVFSRETGKLVACATSAHSAAVTGLFYPGDRRVWSCSADKSVRVWHIPVKEGVKAGLLNLKGKVSLGRTKWKPLWFILKPTEVLFYKSPRDGSPKGTIELEDAVCSAVDQRERESCFQVLTKGGLTFTLQARSTAERSEWLSLIKNAILKLKDPTLANIKMLVEIRMTSPVSFIYHPMDSILAGLTDSTICVIDPTTYELVNTYTVRGADGERALNLANPTNAAHFFCVSSNADILVLVPRTFEHKATLIGHAANITSLYGIGRELWSLSADETIRVWNVDTADCLAVLNAHPGPHSTLLCAGNYMWSAGSDNAIRLWDIKAYFLVKELEQRHTGPIKALLYVGDNRVWSGGHDKTFCVWAMPFGARQAN